MKDITDCLEKEQVDCVMAVAKTCNFPEGKLKGSIKEDTTRAHIWKEEVVNFCISFTGSAERKVLLDALKDLVA